MIPQTPYIFVNDVHVGSAYLESLNTMLEEISASSEPKHLVLERDEVFQELFKYMKNGSSSIEESAYMFCANYGDDNREAETNAWKKILATCVEKGIEIHCVDDRKKVAPDVYERYEAYIANIIQAPTHEEKLAIHNEQYVQSGLEAEHAKETFKFEERVRQKLDELGKSNGTVLTFFGGAHLKGLSSEIDANEKTNLLIWNREQGAPSKHDHDFEAPNTYLFNSDTQRLGVIKDGKYCHHADSLQIETSKSGKVPTEIDDPTAEKVIQQNKEVQR